MASPRVAVSTAVSTNLATPAAGAERLPLLTALKGFACVAIVLHHLAFYGPMSEVARPLMPTVIDWLFEYGRMAVTVFFVISGFLVARSLAPAGIVAAFRPWPTIRRRYLRLVVPMLAALAIVILVTALVRPWFDHRSVGVPPSLLQLVVHPLLGQDWFGQEALSVGVWYVGIDLQLFIVVVAVLSLGRGLGARWQALTLAGPLLIGALTLGSLFVFNRDPGWDASAVYFFGYFGLGCAAQWLAARHHGTALLLLAGVVVIAALVVDFRGRVLVALATMLLLGFSSRYGWLSTTPVPRPLLRLGDISYAVFLIHFPLCLAVSAVFAHWFAGMPVANLVGIGIAVAASLVGGDLFHRRVERRCTEPGVGALVVGGYALAGFVGMLG